MRFLHPDLRAAVDSPVRFPAFKVYAWNPEEVTISQIVANSGTIPEPADLTLYVAEVGWNDRQLTLSLIDAQETLFHPDYGSLSAYIQEQAIIRLVEGDSRLPESTWIVTFTGQIHGQVGWRKSRRSGSLQGKISVLGRGETQAYKRREITSDSYTAGSDIGVAVYDLAHEFLGLTDAELRIPYVLGRQFKHLTNQLCLVSPWDGLASLLEVVCYLPHFDGDGKLTYLNKNLQRQPDKIMADGVAFVEYEVPERNQDSINKIVVTFLDAALSKVANDHQKLGTAQVTTGFFSMRESLECWWSEDRKQRAENTAMIVLKSVNSGILPVGSESYTAVDEFHGVIEVEISIWVPILATVLLLEYLGAAFIPDDVIVGGFIASMGITIPIGRVIQAQAMIGILLIMMSIGSAQYEVWGTPYDYAYLERQSIALENGLDYWQENEMEIKNDFIGTFDQADAVALTELVYQKCLSKPRKIVIADDPGLEVGDIVVLPDGRKVLIGGLSKSIRRGEVPLLTIEGGKIFGY